ncbi:MAG TPA: glycosyltransferase [Sphingomonas sp.]
MNAVPVICFPFVGSLLGGSHISASGLIRRLDRNRFEPLVLLQHPDSAIGDMLRDVGVAFERAPSTAELAHGRSLDMATLLRLAARTPGLARVLKRRHVAIVHGNDGRSQATWAAATRLAGAKLLWHHRGNPDAIGARWAAPVLAHRIVSVSRYAAPSTRATVVHSPFDTESAQDRAEARAALVALLGGDVASTSETRLVGFAGALIDRKRPLRFVEAIAAMRRRSPDSDVRGVMFGQSLNDMERSIAECAAELGVADRIHILGFQQRGAFWLAACDLLLVPAVDEPFGRTLIEAMLVGTPVVATASGGNPEALRDGALGHLVPAEQPEEMAIAALRILDHPRQAQHIADLARADALVRFGEALHADAIMAIYDEMLPSRVQRQRRTDGRLGATKGLAVR